MALNGKVTNQYSHGVRIGNWNEDMVAREEQLAMMDELNKTGEAPHLKAKSVVSIARETVETSAASEESICYGDKVMIVHSPSIEGGGATLCAVPSVHAPTDGGMSVSCSLEDKTPVKRNVYTIEPWTEKKIGDTLCYDDKFCLKVAEDPTNEDKSLYLYSEVPGLSSTLSRYAQEQRVYLRESREGEGAYGVAWVCAAKDVEYRLEMEGEPIQVGNELVIKHCKTGQALSSNYQLRQKLRTEFGVEVEVTANTKINRAKVETPENHFSFST